MKKENQSKSKKLLLNKEVVACLNKTQLNSVVGGYQHPVTVFTAPAALLSTANCRK